MVSPARSSSGHLHHSPVQREALVRHLVPGSADGSGFSGPARCSDGRFLLNIGRLQDSGSLLKAGGSLVCSGVPVLQPTERSPARLPTALLDPPGIGVDQGGSPPSAAGLSDLGGTEAMRHSSPVRRADVSSSPPGSASPGNERDIPPLAPGPGSVVFGWFWTMAEESGSLWCSG